MPDSLFRMACRFRLGIPPDSLPSRCICGASLARFDHFMSCDRLRRRAVTTRHDSIVLFLHRLCLSGGLVAEHEPRLDGVDRSRPDLAMFLDNQLVFTDVTVCHPTAPSLLAYARRPLGAAQLRVGLKHRRYDEICAKDGGSFVPFVLETSGALHRVSRELVRRIAGKLEVSGLASDHRALSAHILRCISFLLHRGNARVILQDLTLSKSTSRLRPPAASPPPSYLSSTLHSPSP